MSTNFARLATLFLAVAFLPLVAISTDTTPIEQDTGKNPVDADCQATPEFLRHKQILESQPKFLTNTLIDKEVDATFFGIWCIDNSSTESEVVYITHFSDGTFVAVSPDSDPSVEIGEWFVLEGFYFQKHRGFLAKGVFEPAEIPERPFYHPFEILGSSIDLIELQYLGTELLFTFTRK